MSARGHADGAVVAPAAHNEQQAHRIVDMDRTEENSQATSSHEDSASPEQSAAVHADNQGIDVAAAEATWRELGRELSRQSKTHAAATGDKDVEKASSDDEFDLREWLGRVQSEASQMGAKHKSLGVSWTDLETVGAASMALNVRTLPDAFMQEFIMPIMTISSWFGYNIFNSGKRKLLQNFTGSARPGEMVLVLGRPGAGCSTFLKTIANQRNGFMAVNGDVKYGGISAAEIKKHYRGEVVYSEEDDLHNATLTVARTIDFALRTKLPDRMLPDHTRRTMRKTIRDTMLKMVNIEHTKHTLVGSEYVRGVSGGERKRVSILEALCTRATVLSWDNASRGLDASTALDYAKSMRILTDLLDATMFISLYQASDSIYELFDKVMVIDEGRCIYYGPREKARPYFVSLGYEDAPRQTASDWIVSNTDRYVRRFQAGRSKNDVPSTPEQLEEAYRQSEVYKEVLAEKTDFDNQMVSDAHRQEEFRAAVRDDKHRGVRPKSQYTVSYMQQVYALWLRSMQMQAGNLFDLSISYLTALTVALLTGGIFFKQPETAAGAFTRGGVAFIGLMFNSLTTFTELPAQMGGRPILYRQNGFAFYRPSALSIAQLFADLPFGLPRVAMFTIALYFMSGFYASAGAFFTFLLVVVVSYYAFRSLFASFGTICRDYNVAARLAAVIIIALVEWSGYVIPRDSMKRWNFWINYMNPLAYAFEALMINEFRNLNLACVGTFIVPSGVGYPAQLGPNQVCTLAGSTPGNPIVPGLSYLSTSFGYRESNLWRNVGILFGFFGGLTLITCLVIENMEQGAFSSALTVTKKANKEEKKLNERLADRQKEREALMEKGEEGEALKPPEVKGKAFTWRNLNYTVNVKGGKRKLLDNVDGYVKPGTLTALMGASGAGKTTLLDVLADRKSVGVIEGERLVEGRPIDVAFRRSTAYGEQQDVHNWTQTVREALRFSAYLRQPASVPKEEKDRYVEEIIELLELQSLADAMIGFPVYGLGVADRKRVTIGVELAAKPEMLLFLDEPTSGLDGQSAVTIVRLLRRLAAAGQTILCTIHQPSALLFEYFDRLCLLQRGGQVVYFGPIGHDAKDLVAWFAENGAHCPPTLNAAEWMLDAIGAGSQKRIGDRDWADVYRESELHRENLREIERINEEGLKVPQPERRATSYAAPFTTQFRIVLQRAFRSSWRNADYHYTRLLQHVVVALLTGLLFLQIGNSVVTVQYRVFSVFVLAIIPSIIMAQVIPGYIMERSVWIREETSKTYSGVVFAITQLVAEIPYALLAGTLYFVIFYYITGFQSASSRAAYFWIMTIVVEFFSISLGTLIASFNPSIYLAMLYVPFIVIELSLTSGVVAPLTGTPGLFRYFLGNVNPLRFTISGLTANELHDLPIRCTDTEFSTFQPPSNQTCSSWAQNYIASVGGYLANPDATADCRYCQYAVGDDFYRPLEISFSNRGRDIGIVIAFTAFNVIGTIAFTKFLKFSNR